MENKHTPDPWITDAKSGFPGDIHDERNCYLLASTISCHVDELEAEANARRIVACVNACAGIKTIYLEAMRGTSILEKANANCDITMKQRDELLADRDTWKARAEFSYQQRDVLEGRASLAEAQRDELLSALERIAAGPGDNRLLTAIQWAKEAIDNVKGTNNV